VWFVNCLLIVYLFISRLLDDKESKGMDPEVHQEMEMAINQPKMKMKTILTLPSEASHLLNHTNT
jgi:hypothetical protein